MCPAGTVTLLPVYKPAHSRTNTQPRSWHRPRHVPPASAVYTDRHVLVLIDTDQIPKILRQPERTCPSTETPVARHLFLRNIRGFRASDASDHRPPAKRPVCYAPAGYPRTKALELRSLTNNWNSSNDSARMVTLCWHSATVCFFLVQSTFLGVFLLQRSLIVLRESGHFSEPSSQPSSRL